MITDETIKELILGLEEAKGLGNVDNEIADQEIECLNELIEARKKIGVLKAGMKKIASHTFFDDFDRGVKLISYEDYECKYYDFKDIARQIIQEIEDDK